MTPVVIHRPERREQAGQSPATCVGALARLLKGPLKKQVADLKGNKNKNSGKLLLYRGSIAIVIRGIARPMGARRMTFLIYTLMLSPSIDDSVMQ